MTWWPPDNTAIAVIGTILVTLAGGLFEGAAFWIAALVILVVELALVLTTRGSSR